MHVVIAYWTNLWVSLWLRSICIVLYCTILFFGMSWIYIADILVIMANRKLFAGLCVFIHVSDLLLKWANDVVINRPTSASSSSSVLTSSSPVNVSAELELGKGRLETLRHSLVSALTKYFLYIVISLVYSLWNQKILIHDFYTRHLSSSTM